MALPRTLVIFTRALVALALLAGCSGGGAGSGTRSIVVLSADEDVEIVLPDDAFTKEVVTTTTTTTTTTQPPKETIPLAEEDINPGLKLMDALGGFNSCLAEEGFEFMGLPNEEAGAGALVNSPDYLEALGLCNSRTGIGDAFQEFQAARSDLTPQQIREDNEDFILLTECLRQKGWTIGELLPDENGLLGPGGSFQSSGGEINTDEIRDCVSELNLAADDS